MTWVENPEYLYLKEYWGDFSTEELLYNPEENVTIVLCEKPDNPNKYCLKQIEPTFAFNNKLLKYIPFIPHRRVIISIENGKTLKENTSREEVKNELNAKINLIENQ